MELISKLWHASDGNDIMFFSLMNEGCPGSHSRKIGRVFLGCNVNNENINKLSTAIKKNEFKSNMIHGMYFNNEEIKIQGILKGKMHSNEYKLQFESLNTSL